MNWLMVAVGVIQICGAGYGHFVAGQGWRINVMNVLVGFANIVLSGAKG